MVKMKNTAYYPVEAIKENKEIVPIMPGMEVEVDDENIERFHTRYPELVEVEEVVKEVIEEKKVKKSMTHKGVAKEPILCEKCGKSFLNKIGLYGHMRSHEKEERNG